MKKILSLVLAMLMIFSMVPAVFAAETSESDYQAAIEYLKAIELYKGTTDGDAADELVERYQMALFTARMVTGRVDSAYWETDANDSDFTDIDALNAEALGGVCYAAQQGIVNGIGGSEFAPFDNVTYRDAIVMIVRALGFNYPDSGYPWSYINKARELGVLDGITGVSYTAEVKREVIAQLLYNAMNAEIKGETIAASVFGVEETIVMVTASPDGIVYGALSSRTNKSSMVRVAAIDAEGEPMGTEYYVPFKALGLKNNAAANAAVGTIYKLTHKGNFSQFLAYESLTQVFENTTEKKDVKVSNDKITLGADTYVILGVGEGYTSLVNNQGTVSGSDEIKLFKSFGAKLYGAIAGEDDNGYDLYFDADGNIYSFANPFVPYAVYSDVVDAWFYVTIDDHGVTRYTLVTDESALLEKVTANAKGFSQLDENNSAYIRTRIASTYGVDYDYYRATASDIDGDGDFDRAIIRQYQLFKFVKGTRDGLGDDGKTTKIDTFTLYQYTGNGMTSSLDSETEVGTFDAEYSYDYETKGYQFFRFTGTSYNKLPDYGFVVAYFANGVESEKEFEVVDVADKMSAYIRGYDQESDSVIYGSEYESIKLGYFGVEGTSVYRATQCSANYVGSWKLSSAKYVRNFWNKYVDMYVLNDSVIYIEDASAANDYVILESFTNFSEEGMTAIAYSTKAGGKAEILVNELNGWNLGGFDYALYEEMLRLQALLPGLGIQTPVLPVELNKVYAVRYVDENGAYNLVEPKNVKEDKEIYINNYGYILGVDKDGAFAANNRVATSDKDLWFILAEDEGKVYSFQGKLAALHLTDADFYKAQNNQFVLSIPSVDQLNGILGDSMEGIEYHMFNTLIDNAYRNEDIFGAYYYDHAMLNMRTGNVEFITYDPVLAAQLNREGKFVEGKYIHLNEGDIFQTVSGVLKNVARTYGIADVAALEFAKGTYVGKAPVKVAVGAVLPVDVAVADIPGNVEAAFVSYEALRDAITEALYEGVYNRDFHQGNVTYQDAIKLELAHKVAFVGIAADGSRTNWNAAKDDKYVTGKTLGSDTDVAYAYVMYDFANAKATVYFDQKNLKELVTITPGTATVNGVDATAAVVYNYNELQDKTIVEVTFSKSLNVTAYDLGTAAATEVNVNNLGIKFAVAGDYTGAISVTAVADALAGLTKVDAADITAYAVGNTSCSVANLEKLVDGIYHETDALSSGDVTMNFSSFADNAYDDNLNNVGGQTKPGAKYFAYYAFELANATAIKGFRLSANDYSSSNSKYSFCLQGVSILVSADGQTWTNVANYYDMVDQNLYVDVDDVIRDYYAASGSLTNTAAVKYVALCVPGAEKAYNDRANVQNGLPQYGSGTYCHHLELELYY